MLRDRVPGLLCLALLLASRVGRTELMLLYGGLLALWMGTAGTVQGSVYTHYFGRRHIGAIKGLTTMIGVAGAAFGPFLFALGPDLFGSYAPLLVLAMLSSLAVGLAALIVSEPSLGGQSG